jgi:ribosomal protein S5
MARKPVSTAEVRTWGRANLALVDEAGHKCLGENARGRLHPAVVKAFRKAHPNRDYIEKAAESKTVSVRVPKTDKNGRVSLRSQTVTYDNAREVAILAGLANEGSRGRLSDEALTVVGAALFA